MSEIQRYIPRTVKLTPNINPYAEGSVLVEFGNTKVHVTASVEPEVPRWLRGQGRGWVTAEYNMLPMSTHSRNRRERKGISGRSQEIQRLIARSLRAAVDLEKLEEKSIVVDCDVIVADGGTRTASITGGYVALAMAIKNLIDKKELTQNPMIFQVAALSVGINQENKIIADLNYEEDSSCDTDMNIVMTQCGKFVEVQGTAEGTPFSPQALEGLIECATKAMVPIFQEQTRVIEGL